MKKRGIITAALAICLSLGAQQKMYVYKANNSLLGAKISEIDSIGFQNNKTELVIYKTDKTTWQMPLSSVDSLKFADEKTPTYTAPSYADDYAYISSYTQRAQWNLANVHDPTVEKCGDYYYMYGTDASYGNVLNGYGHYPYRVSKDLVNWNYIGTAMASPPTWVKDSLNAMRARVGLTPIANPSYGYWAPSIKKAGDVYRMYYCIIVDNFIATGLPNSASNFDKSWTEKAFIGMMESTDLATNTWVDKGYVISSVSDKGINWSRSSYTTDWSAYFQWNAIDPTYTITPNGEHWLIYGSWHCGIPAVQLNPTTGKPFQLNTLADYGTQVAKRVNSSTNRWQGQEGPEVIYNPTTGYYYLFLAYDELSVAYNTRVCRSRNINGPYYGYNGANISQGADCYPIITHPYKFNNHSGWVGFSHCAIFQDPDTNQWYYCSQGRLPANTNGNAYSNAIMMGHIRAIEWTENGWPVVMPERYGAVPQTIIADNDLVGTWEHILLNYSYGTQQTSQALTLRSDYVASGAITGTWSYNATTKILTVGGNKLIVKRELDWEVSPRVPTLVYAGINSSGRSLWGKKVK